MNKEDFLQQKIVIWYRNQYQRHGKGLIFSIPNGGSRNVVEAKKLKETGLMAGASDLIILHGNKCIFVEIKTDTGKQSDTQKIFEQKVLELGFDYIVVKKIEDLVEYFEKLLYL